MLADLGVTKSHSRPHVSIDNPHVEAIFKTTKYQPEFPTSFPNLAAARVFCSSLFAWYSNASNTLTTPAVRIVSNIRIVE